MRPVGQGQALPLHSRTTPCYRVCGGCQYRFLETRNAHKIRVILKFTFNFDIFSDVISNKLVFIHDVVALTNAVCPDDVVKILCRF